MYSTCTNNIYIYFLEIFLFVSFFYVQLQFTADEHNDVAAPVVAWGYTNSWPAYSITLG